VLAESFVMALRCSPLMLCLGIIVLIGVGQDSSIFRVSGISIAWFLSTILVKLFGASWLAGALIILSMFGAFVFHCSRPCQEWVEHFLAGTYLNP